MTMQKAQEQQEQQQKGNDIDDQRLYDVMDNDNAFKENQYKRNSSHNSADADAEAEAYSQVTLNFAKRAAHAAATARQLNEHDNNNSFSDSQRDLRRAPTSGLTTITAT